MGHVSMGIYRILLFGPILWPGAWSLPSCYSLGGLEAGKGTLYAMYCLSTNRRWANSKMRNVNPCPRESEGVEYSDRYWLRMILFVKWSLNGWLLGLVYWRAEYGLVLYSPMLSLLGTRIIGGVARRCLRHRTYSTILVLHRCFVENPRWQPNLPMS